MRIRFDIAYDGAAFHGWAKQRDLRTVQGVLEEALATILRIEEPPALTCAGRTDTGVHARGQVAHADLADDVDPARLAHRLRRLLPDDVAVRAVTRAPEGFDARFAAVERRYVYRIDDDTTAYDPLTRNHIVAWPRPLDVGAMTSAADHLLGEHDFAAFCKKRAGATTIRTLLELSPRRTDSGVIETTVRADAFCHSMVRALMGALVAVGEGRFEPAWTSQILRAEERDPRVKVMSAHGLTLEEVVYPADGALADRARTARTRRTLSDR